MTNDEPEDVDDEKDSHDGGDEIADSNEDTVEFPESVSTSSNDSQGDSDDVSATEESDREGGNSADSTENNAEEEVSMNDLRPEETGFDESYNSSESGGSATDIERRRQENYEATKYEDDSDEVDEEETLSEEEFLIDTDEKSEEEEQEERTRRLESEEFDWNEEVSEALQKIQIWRSDRNASEAAGVRNAPRRAKEYFLNESAAKDYLKDIVLPLTLVIYGFVLLLVSIFAGIQGGSLGATFTEPNRIADLFLLDSVLLLTAAVVFVLARRSSNDTSIWNSIRQKLRLGVIGLHIIPTFVFILVIFGTFQSGLLSNWSQTFLEWRIYLNSILPSLLTDSATALWELTPLGVTIQQVSLLMFVLGIAASVPFAVGIAKVIIVAINTEEEKDLAELAALNLTGPTVSRKGSSVSINESVSVESRGEDVIDVDNVDNAFESVNELFETNEEYKIEPYPGYTEHKRYWVNKPYAYVVILYSERNSDYRYYIVEPERTAKEDAIYEELNDKLSRELLTERIEEHTDDESADQSLVKTKLLEDNALRIAQMYDIDVSDKSFQKIMYYLERDYINFGKIDPMMQDPNTEDISCDGDNMPIFIYHADYQDLISNVKYKKDELREFVMRLAQVSDENISVANPMVDASLPDGSRAQLTLGEEVTANGSTFTLRIFQDTPFTPIDLISTGTFNLQQIAYLWLCIQHNRSLIFAGGTASGKTTTMNAISLFIPPKEKIVSLEDTRELTLPHANWVPSVTRDSFGGESVEDIDMYNLLESALRQRPEYLLVGEVRGPEAVSLFQAMSTGHTTYSTMHADSVESAVYRLTNPPIEVPEEMIQALDIMCIQNQKYISNDGESGVKRVRRNEKIVEVERVDGNFNVEDAFYLDAEYDEFVADIDDSSVLEDIREQQGWTPADLRRELNERKEVLEYMLHNGYDSVEDVTQIVQAYIINSERVMNRLDEGTLSPDEFDDISEVNRMNTEFTDTVLPHKLEQAIGNLNLKQANDGDAL